MGIGEWFAGFSLPKTEDECNALRTAETDAAPVQWIDSKCKFYNYSDEARLGMSTCSSGQIFDPNTNICSEQVEDTACPIGQYRPIEGETCIAIPPSTFDQAALSTMADCSTKVIDNGTMGWSNGACNIMGCNDGFTSNGVICEANCPDVQERDPFDGACKDKCLDGQERDPNDGVCKDIPAFTNRQFSERELMILIILVVLMYMYRKELKKALRKAKIIF